MKNISLPCEYIYVDKLYCSKPPARYPNLIYCTSDIKMVIPMVLTFVSFYSPIRQDCKDLVKMRYQAGTNLITITDPTALFVSVAKTKREG